MNQEASVVECDPAQCGEIALDLPVCVCVFPPRGNTPKLSLCHDDAGDLEKSLGRDHPNMPRA